MIRWLIPFLLAPCVAFADPVSIRSGEHDSFTRFVVDIGKGTGWQVSKTDGGFLLRLDGRADGFDTSTVFTRIPRARVLNVTERTSSVLFFATACECEIDGFLYSADQLVVDIVGEVAPQRLASVSRMRPVARPTTGTGAALPDLLALQGGETRPPPLMLTDAFEMPEEAAPPQRAATPAQRPSDDLSATEVALLEGVARASSQGFLDAAVTAPVEPAPVDAPAPVVPDPEPETPASPGRPGVGISTAMDRDLAAVRDLLAAQTGPQCLDDALFRLDLWADDRAFHVQAADMAEALAGEFGVEPRAAQDDLARLYLHFGFGAEARAVLSADSTRSQDRSVLLQLAGLIDDYDEDYPLLAAQTGCETSGALWAFLAAPQEIGEPEQNHLAQMFFMVPQPLRSHIAPRLARELADLGMAEAAARLLRATRNRDAGDTHDTVAAQAVVAESQNRPEEALATLAQEAADNARTSPESVIRLLELGHETGTPPAEADLVLAGAMRLEHRDTPVADRLAVAEATGRMQLRQYAAVFALLAGREDPPARDVLNAAVQDLTTHSDDAAFLEFAFGDLPPDLTAQTGNALARRLLDLGFPDRAATFLDGPAQRETAAERRYLRAEAALALGAYPDVIDTLLGMTDSRANALRSRAYAGMGEHDAALTAAPADDPETQDDTLKFRAGAWERLADEDDSALSVFATTVLSEGGEAPAESLADRRAILAQSQESRRAVESLLTRFDVEGIGD
ncbi:hypothetical protein [Thalassorhabdomicrobium marinisediminis]|uniref:hypothetical protein n=1 Tax=Thalassorhabdomicrobium marinisediminis TaxID=2170577 RepID=UPI002490F5F6|nr:hypothetical protein [Thalassorhabdomicrobium marinisediminis]